MPQLSKAYISRCKNLAKCRQFKARQAKIAIENLAEIISSPIVVEKTITDQLNKVEPKLTALNPMFTETETELNFTESQLAAIKSMFATVEMRLAAAEMRLDIIEKRLETIST